MANKKIFFVLAIIIILFTSLLIEKDTINKILYPRMYSEYVEIYSKEFGLDENGTLTLMDEVLTPDSSRFWSVDTYKEGTNPPSFDKQFVRDWLEQSGWNKQPPAPKVPKEVIEKTVAKYQEALDLLTK